MDKTTKQPISETNSTNSSLFCGNSREGKGKLPNIISEGNFELQYNWKSVPEKYISCRSRAFGWKTHGKREKTERREYIKVFTANLARYYDEEEKRRRNRKISP